MKMHIVVRVACWVSLAASVAGARVSPLQQCLNGNGTYEDLVERVDVKPCGKTKCKLQHDTNITVTLRFKPTQKVESITNEVSALIAGISFPFFGVDGTDACGSVRRAGGEPASCPLEPGLEYEYTASIPVEPYYPTLPLQVHWALNDGSDQLICFEVPAVITKNKKKKY